MSNTIVSRFVSLIPHHTSPQLFDSGRGVPVFHGPDQDVYLTYQGGVVYRGAGPVGAITAPMGAPLPPVPLSVAPGGHWLYPAAAPVVPGFGLLMDQGAGPGQKKKCSRC